MGFWDVLGAYATLAGLIWTMLNGLDHVVGDDVKAGVAQWLRDRGARVRDWDASFIRLFDGVMVPVHRRGRWLPWPGVLRSMAASLLFTALFFLLYLTLHGSGVLPQYGNFEFIRAIISTIIFINIPSDYISYMETRLVLHLIIKSNRAYAQFAYILADIFLTLLIFGVVAFLFLEIGRESWWYSEYSGVNVVDFILTITPALVERILFIMSVMFESYVTGGAELGIVASVLFSALATSIWVWLYVLGGALVRKCVPLFRARKDRGAPVVLERAPLSVMGYALMLALLPVFFVWAVYTLVA